MNSRRIARSVCAVLVLVIGLSAAGLHGFGRRAHSLHPKSGLPILVPGPDGPSTLLFNGWHIQPVGRPIPTGDMPVGGAISPNGRIFAIANCGFSSHSVNLIDLTTESLIARVPLAHAGNGIAWSLDGSTLYVSGGVSVSHRDIFVLKSTAGVWSVAGTLSLTGNDPRHTCIAGLALSADGKLLFVANNSDNRLYVLDPASGVTRFAAGCGDHPGVVRLGPDGRTLAITAWGGSEITIFMVERDASLQLTTRIVTGPHPNDMAFSRDGRLFVTCGNADAVYVHQVRTGRLIETIRTTPTAHAPSGSTPVALALSPDGQRLFVANADNNNVCVVKVGQSGLTDVQGFIPTGWYPTAVAVSLDGKKLIIASGKGEGSAPNLPTDHPASPVSPNDYKFRYIANQLSGIVSIVGMPDQAALRRYSAAALAAIPYRDRSVVRTAASSHSAIPATVGASGPIRHVLYIIKENRSYDQVFGDLPRGNGDPDLTLFGRDVTANHHALAEQFVLLDNVYCNGEVSQDGHPWCDAALATDFTQRAWVLYYSGKGSMAGGEQVETPAAGYLWDACKRKGLSYRSYGEAVHAASIRTAPDQQVEGATGLAGHGSAAYVGSDRPAGAGPMRDTEKAAVFIQEFHGFERQHTVPSFMIMSLGEDHTSGTLPGAFTPKAAVASNDLALGRIVDAVSHSREWNTFAIFVIEDDAQNGPDHVDSHRTVCLAISPYIKRRTVDSTMYSTASIVRSIELILGLAPMTQYDAAATPLFPSFSDRADLTPYTALPVKIDLNERNRDDAIGAAESRRMDFTAYDRADPDKLNAVLWRSIKGSQRNLTPRPPSLETRFAGGKGVTLP